MKKVTFLFLIFATYLNASYKDGREVYLKKCASCHIEYIPFETIMSNFKEHKNKLLNLKVPPFSRIEYKIYRGNLKITSANDDLDFQKGAIEDYMRDFLENPSYDKSLFSVRSRKYFKLKDSMQGVLSDDDYTNLADYIMQYKQNIAHISKEKKKLSSDANENDILSKAKAENKMIIIEASSNGCHYCEKMKKEVFSDSLVKEKLHSDFVFFDANVDKRKLPFNLEKSFPKVTPTFFILDGSGKLLNMYPGSWNKKDFLSIMKENKNPKK